MFLFNWFQSTETPDIKENNQANLVLQELQEHFEKNNRQNINFVKDDIIHTIFDLLQKIKESEKKKKKIKITTILFSYLCNDDVKAFLRTYNSLAKTTFYKMHELHYDGLTLDCEYRRIFYLGSLEYPLGGCQRPNWDEKYIHVPSFENK